MRGNFIVGLALGAIAGMTLIDSSSQIKSIFKKGKKAVTDMADNMGQSQDNQG